MKMLALSLIVGVGSVCSLATYKLITLPEQSWFGTAPRYRIPKEQLLTERHDQLKAIIKVFARRTSADRAKYLAKLCYDKTLNTPFTPLDLAEIALAETGGHQLSGKAVSSRGALGVWQLMPERARSHGYRPADMRSDDKCAAAAVRELAVKLEMARGDLMLAKKYYCGVGPDADAYELKRMMFRRELLLAMPVVGPEGPVGGMAQVERAYWPVQLSETTAVVCAAASRCSAGGVRPLLYATCS